MGVISRLMKPAAAVIVCRRMSSSSSIYKRNDLFLVSRFKHETKKQYFSLISTKSWAKVGDFHSPHFGYFKHFVDKSCKGLRLLSKSDRIWNPWTNEFKLLPPSYVPRPPNIQSHSFKYVGFGFDSKSRDYKVLRLVSNHSADRRDHRIQLQFELYSLNNDSWKEIPSDPAYPYFPYFDFDRSYAWNYYFAGKDSRARKEILEDPNYPYFNSGFPSDFVPEPSDFTYANGCCYWATKKNNVLSFDFATESFSCFSLPKTGTFEYLSPYGCFIDGSDWFYDLVEYNGLLGVIVYLSTSNRSAAHLPRRMRPTALVGRVEGEFWIRDDGTWKRKFEFHVPFEGEEAFLPCVWFSSDDRLFFRGRERRSGYVKVMVYDLRTREFNKFYIQDDCPLDDGVLDVFPYVENVVDFNQK